MKRQDAASQAAATRAPRQPGDFDGLSKVEVRSLADRLAEPDRETIETCVAFVCAESANLWHGRGRAMMCRRLKHVTLAPEQKRRLLEAILLHRLEAGIFSEQFRDQLRLALHLDAAATFAAARVAAVSRKGYVRRLARWVLAHADASGAGRPSG